LRQGLKRLTSDDEVRSAVADALAELGQSR
jgi:hypothetical protein